MSKQARIKDVYFDHLLYLILQSAKGELPVRLNTKQLTPLNEQARKLSGRPKIIQIKDISYSFDEWLTTNKGLTWLTVKNGEWELCEVDFKRSIELPVPIRSFSVNRRASKISDYLSGGEKNSSNETRSLYELYAAGAFAKFYGVEFVEFAVSTGRTRSMPIELKCSPSRTLTINGLQIESDGVLAFEGDGKTVYSPIEAKEGNISLWWRQLFYPYWDRVKRHPTAEILITVVLKSAPNAYSVYCLKFTSSSPNDFEIVDSAKVSLV